MDFNDLQMTCTRLVSTWIRYPLSFWGNQRQQRRRQQNLFLEGCAMLTQPKKSYAYKMYHYQKQDNNNTAIKVSVTKCHGTYTEKDKTEEIFGKRFCCLTGGRQAWLKGECPRKMHRFSSDMSWLPGPTSLHHNGLLSLSKTRGNCKSFLEISHLE